MKRLTPTLIGLALALIVNTGPALAHSYSSGGWGMHGSGMMNPSQLSDEHLDRMGDMMAERFRSMQAIASEEDPEARRELLREHFKNMHGSRQGQGNEPGKPGHGMTGQGMTGQGMMGQGMMGQGMTSQGMMGHGMMGHGMMGHGMMGHGMMGHGMMGHGMMMHHGQFNDEHLDLMGEHMAEQHARMTRIAETSDKAERRELLREHFEAMREFMEKMHGS